MLPNPIDVIRQSAAGRITISFTLAQLHDFRRHYYQKCVAETVQRFGGFVAKYMGDGVSSATDTAIGTGCSVTG